MKTCNACKNYRWYSFTCWAFKLAQSSGLVTIQCENFEAML